MEKYEVIKNANIRYGQKVTICVQGGFCGIVVQHAIFYEIKPNRPYMDCPESEIGVTLICKLRGKRRASKTIIPYNVPFIIYDSWINIDTGRVVFGKSNSSGTSTSDHKFFIGLKETYPHNILCMDTWAGASREEIAKVMFDIAFAEKQEETNPKVG